MDITLYDFVERQLSKDAEIAIIAPPATIYSFRGFAKNFLNRKYFSDLSYDLNSDEDWDEICEAEVTDVRFICEHRGYGYFEIEVENPWEYTWEDDYDEDDEFEESLRNRRFHKR